MTSLHSRQFFFKHALILIFLCFWVNVSSAQQNISQDTLNSIEDYMNSITTIEGRFIQANPDGSYAEGQMYLSKPGKMRFEYDPPIPIMLVANGVFFIHVDKELKNTTHIPLDSTPASFFLSENFSFDETLTLSAFEQQNGLIRLKLFQTEDPELGSLILTFTETPLELKQWTILDTQNLQTTVTLVGTQFGTEIDPELFNFKDPWRNRNRDR